MRKYLKHAFLIVLTLLLFSLSGAWGQSIITGGVSGTVTDSTGAGVGGANLTLKSTTTTDQFTATSSSAGDFVFSLLKPGEYTLTVVKDGFKTVHRSVTVQLGTTINASVSLEIGSATTTIEVVAASGAQIQTESSIISTVYETKQIQEIPNPGGDVTYIAQTAPGITMNSSAGGGYGNFSTFGLPGTANLFTLNGNDYNCPFLNLNNSGSSNLLLGGNEIQEVSVVNNAYTGQYGRQAGAQIDYSTKSGTNGWHGNAVYDWTGRYLNANDPLLKAQSGVNHRPFENNNQWAASQGGPILKDKLYFFFNTEGIRYIFGSVKPATIPTPAFQNAILANLPSVAGAQLPQTTAFYQNVFKLYNSAPGISAAAPIANSCTGIPTAVATSVGNQCTETWTDSVPSGNKEWLLSGRFDWKISDKDSVFGRMKFDRGTQPTYTDVVNPQFDTFSVQPQNEGQISYTHVFNPTLINNFLANVLYYSAIFGSINPSSPALGLFPGVLNFTDGSVSSLGFGAGQGGYFNNFFFPQGRNVTQWGLVDDLSKNVGSHAFKMGVTWRRDDISDFTASQVAVFPATNVNLAGFYNDTANNGANFNFAKSTPQPIAIYTIGLYFQDEYRVNTKLKVTMTLRADRNSGGVCQSHCAGLPVVPFTDLPKGGNIPYDQSFLTGSKTIIPHNELISFQPRAGFAWTPFGNRTVLRGGVGLFTDLYPGFILSSYDTNFPQVNLWNVPVSTPGSLAWDLKSPATTAFPNSGIALVEGCNALFTSNYNSGGNLNSYAAAGPQCLNGLGQQAVPNISDVSRNLQNPKYVEWNFEIQHQLTPHTVVSANYVGNRGYSELYNNNYLNGYLDAAAIGSSGLSNATLPAAAPDPRVGKVSFLQSGAVSNYNGLVLSVRENNWHGLSGQFSYTYSHALDETSNGGTLPFGIYYSILQQINPQGIQYQYASADYDARHQLNASYLYALPFKSSKRALDAAIGGWQISGTFFFRKGFPFSAFDGGTIGGLTGNNLNGAVILLQPTFTQRNFGNVNACITGPCFGILPGGAYPAGLNTTAPFQFAAATNFTGAVGRNAFRGPGFLGDDISLRKNFTITERVRFQLGLNAYNWLNHANYGAPIANTAFGGAFGQVLLTEAPPTSPYGAFATAATDMRIAQITGKLSW